MDMFQQDEEGELGGVGEEINVDTSITYDELVKDIIQEKKTYIRELNMIIKVGKGGYVSTGGKREKEKRIDRWMRKGNL